MFLNFIYQIYFLVAIIHFEPATTINYYYSFNTYYHFDCIYPRIQITHKVVNSMENFLTSLPKHYSKNIINSIIDKLKGQLPIRSNDYVRDDHFFLDYRNRIQTIIIKQKLILLYKEVT